MSTINPVAVAVSFEVCAMGSGIKGDSVRRHSMVLSGHRSSGFVSSIPILMVTMVVSSQYDVSYW